MIAITMPITIHNNQLERLLVGLSSRKPALSFISMSEIFSFPMKEKIISQRTDNDSIYLVICDIIKFFSDYIMNNSYDKENNHSNNYE